MKINYFASSTAGSYYPNDTENLDLLDFGVYTRLMVDCIGRSIRALKQSAAFAFGIRSSSSFVLIIRLPARDQPSNGLTLVMSFVIYEYFCYY